MINVDKYELVIGLEVHAQLQTRSKIFCGDNTTYGASPNTQVSAISLAHPGTLPQLNVAAVEYAVKLGLALHCDINSLNYFARKNYFYPDLPKGYQVTQHTEPICKNGYISITTEKGERNVTLNRIHLEEDAGKSNHGDQFSSIDLNRAGVCLVEIVSEPDLHSAEEAYAYITELRKIVRWLGVCDGNMEEGSLRCDANISIRLKGEKKLGTRVEIKNLNSIRNVKRAIEIEFDRLVDIIEKGGTILQETRSFDADNNATFSLRSKEEADDYRYFTEPDLPPVQITTEYIQKISSNMPALPDELKSKFISAYLLNEYDANLLVSDKETADFFTELIQETSYHKASANWINGPLKFYCNENQISISEFPVSLQKLAELIKMVEESEVSFNNASSRILQGLIADKSKTAAEVAEELNLLQESSTSIVETWIRQVLDAMPDKIIEYKKGKKGLQGLFAGEVKKLSKGKADMQIVNKLLLEKLNQ